MRRRTVWKWLVFGIATAVVIVLVWVGARPQPRSLETAAVERRTISAWVEERGLTRLPRTWRIAMPIDGRVLPIEFAEGDRVRAGEVVARLDALDLETAVAQHEARVRYFDAQIARNEDSRLELIGLEQIEAMLVSTRRAVEAAAARTEASAAQETFLAREAERLAEARERGATTATEYEEAQLAALQSRVAHRQDMLTLRALEGFERAMLNMPRAVDQWIDRKAHTSSVLRHERAQAVAALERAQRDRARAVITSPIEGVVLRRLVSSELVLRAGEALLEIGGFEHIEVEADFLTAEALRIRDGHRMEIFDLMPDGSVIEGRVRLIEPGAFTKVSSLGVEQQRVRVIGAFADESTAALVGNAEVGVGYRVRVRIHTDRQEQVLVVPRIALVKMREGGWRVFIVRDGRAQPVAVEVGLSNDDEAEIRGDVAEGEQVILAPPGDLAPGARVEGVN